VIDGVGPRGRLILDGSSLTWRWWRGRWTKLDGRLGDASEEWHGLEWRERRSKTEAEKMTTMTDVKDWRDVQCIEGRYGG